MYDAKEVQKAITDIVRNSLKLSKYENTRIAPDDDDEDIERPSIKIRTESRYEKNMLIQSQETTAEIYFYAEDHDDYEIDCLVVQGLISGALMDGVQTENDRLYPENIDCSTVKGILAISFTLLQEEAVVLEPGEEIESLHLNIK